MGDWKLIEYFEDGGLELFDLRNDIGETHNLASENSAKTRELHQALTDWRRDLAAPVPRQRNPKYQAAK